MHIELKHLQLIYNIDQLGNLSKCADAMHITQPAASHLLKSLETQLGSNVYHRINKKMVLTKAGIILLSAAKEILPKMDNYKSLLSNEINGNKGSIRIATQCNTSYTWLPEVLGSFQHQYPGIEVEIKVGATSNPTKYLEEGKIDLAIMIDPIKENQFKQHKLFQDEVVLIVSKSHPLSSKKIINAEDFSEINYIMYDEKFENNSIAAKVMIPNEVRPKKVTRLQLTEAILEMVRAGMGAASISNWLLRSYANKNDLVAIKITPKGIYRNWAMLSLKDKNVDYLNEFVKHFQSNVFV